jgi:hypothetical protein
VTKARATAGSLALLTLATSVASAQGFETRDLGAGLSVRQVSTYAYCWGAATPCTVWEPIGFSFAGIDALRVATTFARVPETGRIVAAVTGVRPWRTVRSHGVLYTDDLGATWSAARWDWPVRVRVIAFEPTSLRGIAAGEGGYVWTTDDGGATWTDRGSSSGTTYLDAARLGDTVVLVDDHGAAWRSRDGGFARESLAEGLVGALRVEGREIVVPVERGLVRVRDDGAIRRP